MMMMKPGACSKSRAWRVAGCPLAASNKFFPPWPLLDMRTGSNQQSATQRTPPGSIGSF
jgi:hypothetical protein